MTPHPTHRPSLFQSLTFWWVLIALAGVAMAKVSWRKWADVQVDFPLQLYLPWRLSEGDVMYRDFDYLFGPVTQYLHALVFKLFGVGFMTLAGFSMCLMVVLIFLIVKLFLKTADLITAGMCGMTFIGVFGFAHYMARGNNNFVTPYTYEITHGVLFAFAGCLLFAHYLNQPGRIRALALGFLTGLIFLVKLEVTLAWVAAFGSGVLFAFLWGIVPRARMQKDALWFFPGWLAGPLIFTLYLSIHMPVDQVVSALIKPYLFVLDSPLPSVPLYKYLLGFDDIGKSLERVTFFFGGYVVVAGMGLGFHRLSSGDEKRSSIFLLLISLIFFGGLYFFFDWVPWFNLVSGLQLFLLLYCAVRVVQGFKLSKEGKVSCSFLIDLVLAVLALGFLAKMILNVHLHNYGFVLAMPATLMFVKFWIYDLAELGEKLAPGQRLLKGYGILLVSLFIVSLAWISAESYKIKTFGVGWGQDRIVDYDPAFHPRSAQFQEALEYLKDRVKPGDTMTSIPNGMFFNYQLRVPTREPSFTYYLWDDALNGKDALRNNLEKNPPDWIVLVEMVFEGMNASYFGEDYSVSGYQWIRENYQPVFTSGHVPFTRTGLGVQVLRGREKKQLGNSDKFQR